MPVVFDPFFASAAKPDLAYGTSPFRARGVVCRSDLARIAETVPGGVPAVLAASGDEALAAFFRQSFSPSGWYDVVPLAVLARVCARMRGITFAQYVREAAKHYVEVALGGFSGAVLRAMSDDTIALWLPRVAAWFNDFGAVETRQVEPGTVRAVRSGLPRYIVLGMTVTIMEFVEETLKRKGAKDVRVHPFAAEPDGERAGVPLYRVPFEVRWRV